MILFELLYWYMWARKHACLQRDAVVQTSENVEDAVSDFLFGQVRAPAVVSRFCWIRSSASQRIRTE